MFDDPGEQARAVALSPHDAAADTYLKAILLGSRDATLSSALRGLREAARAKPISVGPDDVAAYARFRGDLKAADRGQLQQAAAEAAYRWAKFLHPDDAPARRDLGDLLNGLGRTAEAAEEYCAAIEAVRRAEGDIELFTGLAVRLTKIDRPELVAVAYRDEKGVSGIQVAYGHFLATAERFDEAIEAYASGGGSWDLAWGDLTAVDALADLADTLVGLGRPAEAEAALCAALEMANVPAPLLLRLGRLLAEQERFDEALHAYRECLEERDYRTLDELTDALIALGGTLQNKGDQVTACNAYRTAIGVSPENTRAHTSLGHARRKLGLLDHAAESYHEAIRLDPGHIPSHNGLGLVQLARKDFAKAEELFRTTIKMNADDPVLRFNLGVALYAQRSFGEATAEFTQVVRLDPKHPDAYRYLGDTLQGLDRLAEAASSYHKAIRLDPDDNGAHDGLDTVLDKIQARLLTLGTATVRPADSEEDDGQEEEWEEGEEGEETDDGEEDGDALEIAELLEAALDGLSDHDRAIEIFSRRTFAAEPETLDQIGQSWGKTRERIRQLERDARAALVHVLQNDTPLDWAAAEVRELIGTLLPLSDLLRRIPSLAEEVESVAEPAWRMLSRLDAAYEIADDWCAAPTVEAAKAETSSWLQQNADTHGVVAMAGFPLLLGNQSVADPDEAARNWLAYCGYEVHGDRVFTKASTIGDRASAVLSATGSPLSAQEILDHLPGGHSLASFRNALALDKRLMRVDRDTWALTEWGMGAYSTIRDQIRQELEGVGGEIPIDLLIRSITSKFSVAESSVRAYADAPPFESSGGIVRFAATQKASSKGLLETPRLYQGDTRWLYRVTITSEHMRGSGSPAPVALAALISVPRGSSCQLSSPLGPQLFSWVSLQPAFGTIQRFLIKRNLVVGQQVFLVVGADLSFDIRLVATRWTTPMARALGLVGCDTTDEADAWPDLALTVGLPEGSSATEIIDAYLDRGDDDVADLLQQVRF